MTVHANMEEYARESRELLAGCLERAAVKAAERLKAGMDAAIGWEYVFDGGKYFNV